MSPARPPDHDGWWNHPVAFAFAGTDATSGIAACDTVNYTGPDGDASKVTGSCTDVAGNTASASFPIKYDATPPTVTAGSSDTTKTGEISLNWAPSADAVSSTVVRSPGTGGAPATEVYSGPNRSLTDFGVVGGETYTYTITVSDPAGNVASATMTVNAKGAPLAVASRIAAPRLDWRSIRGADYYNVQLFRGTQKVLSTWPTRPRLRLRRSWRYLGRRQRLVAGTYRWYVWPGYGRRSRHRYGRLLGTREFTINVRRAR
jgi:hypothetical protein